MRELHFSLRNINRIIFFWHVAIFFTHTYNDSGKQMELISKSPLRHSVYNTGYVFHFKRFNKVYITKTVRMLSRPKLKYRV